MNSSVTAIVTYIYDIWGNILTTTGAMATTLGTRPLRYCGYVYDGSTLVWKEGRRLQSITKDGKTASYLYNADGQRTKKTYPDGSYTKFCVVDGRVVGEIIYKKTANGVKWSHGMRYIYGDDGSVVGFGLWDANTTGEWERYYFIKNLQGDVLKVYRDADNVEVASYTYDPFGNILTKSGEMADENPFRYRGYYYDTETGFYYLKSRYYDPLTCRFINADSYASTGQGFLGYNMFTYCNNNPIVMQDPDGTIATATLMLIGSAIVGAFVNVATTYIAAKVTSQNYTVVDGVVAAVSGAVNAFGPWGRLISGLISGGYAGYMCWQSGGNAGQIILCGVFSAVCTTASIGNLASFAGTSLDLATSAFVDFVFGTGYNSMSAGTYKAVTDQAKSETAGNPANVSVGSTAPTTSAHVSASSPSSGRGGKSGITMYVNLLN